MSADSEIDADHGRSRFDLEVPRNPARSVRWAKYLGRDVIPLWVADMDFAAPDPVVAAIREVAAEPIYGYAAEPRGLSDRVAAYCLLHYRWQVDPQWLIWIPGLVPALNVAVRALAPSGSGVLVMPPIYPPFRTAPALQGARAVEVPLLDLPSGAEFDLHGIETALAADSSIRLLMLCHPHNPVGRAWRREELEALAQLVERFDLLVCSDEVHCDLILDDSIRHLPFASLPGMAARTITLMAPSKTYNVAGLGAAWVTIPDSGLRQRFRQAMQGLLPHLGAVAFAAMDACVSGECEKWRQQLLDYLRANCDLVAASASRLGLPMRIPEATFLAWIDARRIGRAHRLLEQGGVGLSDGADFGAPGYLRLNFGTQRSLLAEALSRMERTFAQS